MRWLLILIVALLVFFLPLCLLGGELEIHFLDVGQGDATLVRTASGKVVLVDTGPSERMILEHLERLEVARIDLLIASHPHADHITGMDRVIERYRPRYFLHPGLPHTTRTYERLIQAIRDYDTRYLLAAPRRITLGSITLTVLPPAQPLIEDSPFNNNSAVIRLDYGNISVLFTGDIEQERETILVDRAGDTLDVNVLKVAHHGSRSSSSQVFLHQVSPDMAVIFCGVDNRYGHPHQETLNSLEAFDIFVFRTDRDGTILLRTDGKTYTVMTDAAIARRAQGREARAKTRGVRYRLVVVLVPD